MQYRSSGILVLALCISVPAANAQEHPPAVTGDTGYANRIVLIDPGLSLGRATFLFPSTLGRELPFHDLSLTSPQFDPGPAGPFIGGFLEPRADLMSPLRLQMERDRLSPLQSALGAVQLGAVGYLAYRHIKKYGLFR